MTMAMTASRGTREMMGTPETRDPQAIPVIREIQETPDLQVLTDAKAPVGTPVRSQGNLDEIT